MAFSSDMKYIVAQSGSPDWTMTYWSWEKGKTMASMRTSNVHAAPITQVSFNPNDAAQVCVTGEGIFKLFRYSEGVMKQFGFQKLDIKVK